MAFRLSSVSTVVPPWLSGYLHVRPQIPRLMVSNYSEYILRYIRRPSKGSPPAPGEHHFVAVYLIPRLHAINGLVPDYVNPDGTKSIIGDVVYYKDEQHHFGIEVKLGTVRLTKKEFNDWIVNEDSSLWPSVFLGIGSKGLALSSWSVFRTSYVAAVRAKNPRWTPEPLDDGYGPMKGVDELARQLPQEAWFPLAAFPEANASEANFMSHLRTYVEA
jgi:hypothetical protein